MRFACFIVAIMYLCLGGVVEDDVSDGEAGEQDTGLGQKSMDELLPLLPPADTEVSIRFREPGSLEDREHPASVEMERRLKKETLSDEQWRFVLLHTRSICVRPKWPADEPFAISMAVPRWLGLAQIRAEPRDGTLSSAKVGELIQSFSGTFPAMRYRDAKYQMLGRLEPGRHTLVFDVAVERGRSIWALDPDMPEEEEGVIWEGTMTFEVEVVETVDLAVPPVSDPELDAAVRASLGAGLREWHTNEGPRMTAFVNLDPDIARIPVLGRTALSLTVDLLHDDVVQESRRIIASRWDTLSVTSSVSDGPLRLYGSTNLGTLPAGIEDDESELARWSIRVQGTPYRVLALWDADQRWAGEFTVPISELLRQEKERVGPGGRGPEMSTPFMR